MRGRPALALAIFCALLATSCAGGDDAMTPAEAARTDAWMRASGLGPYKPAEDDWPAIEAAARAEGEVVVYSLSSRINDVAKTFRDRYGIRVRAFDMGTTDLIEKVTREHDAGVFNADVLFVGDPAVVMNELVTGEHIVNFVPSDIAATIEPHERDPILYHHYGAKVLMYNTAAYPNGPGIDTLWDLTRPEWSGRLTMKDPLKSPENLDFLASVVEHGDEMAQLYEKEFGETLVTSEPNAGYEFLKRLLANRPVLTSGDDETAKSIGDRGRQRPPIGLIGASKLRLIKEQGLALGVVQGLAPAAGVTYPSLLGIARRAPHPNAAKLMIRWMMGDEKGGEGYAPYYLEGDYPVRSDVPILAGLPVPKELGIWEVDPTWLYQNSLLVRDYWIANGGTSQQ